VTDDPHLIEETRALLRTERELIIRQPGAGGWCDGMAGVALARAAMLALPRCAPLHAELTEDLRASVDRIHGALTAGEPADDSLCHGRLGMLEALRTAHQHGDGTLDPLLDRALADLAHRVLAGRLRTGVPTGVWTPGLLTGAAGVGYGLLRAAAPHRIPDILTLS
jgi:lantibiotic modifying enzyme